MLHIPERHFMVKHLITFTRDGLVLVGYRTTIVQWTLNARRITLTLLKVQRKKKNIALTCVSTWIANSQNRNWYSFLGDFRSGCEVFFLLFSVGSSEYFDILQTSVSMNFRLHGMNLTNHILCTIFLFFPKQRSACIFSLTVNHVRKNSLSKHEYCNKMSRIRSGFRCYVRAKQFQLPL